MELALELVNLVPPEMADRLMKRMHEAEAELVEQQARCAQAEELLARLEEEEQPAEREEGEAVAEEEDEELPRSSRAGCCCRLVGVVVAAVVTACLLAIGGAGVAALLASAGILPAPWHLRVEAFAAELCGGVEEEEHCAPERLSEASAPPPHPHAYASAALSSRSRPAVVDEPRGMAVVSEAKECGDIVQEAIEEREELRLQHAEVQQGYRHALEAVSLWLEFLRGVWVQTSAPGTTATAAAAAAAVATAAAAAPAELDQQRRGCSPRELEARCAAAYEPGRKALMEMLRRGGTGMALVSRLAERLERHRGRQMAAVMAPPSP